MAIELKKIDTTEGSATTAQEGGEIINGNFALVKAALENTVPQKGDVSANTAKKIDVPTRIPPVSGISISLWLSTLWKWISDIVSGAVAVGKATQADQDGDGRNIKSTYATKTEVDQKVVGIYRLKGSIQNIAALLALTGVKQGDVYDVREAGTLGGQPVNAGDNIAATADNPTVSQWDNLAGKFDASNLLPKTGDASDTVVIFSQEAGEPTSGTSLHSIIGRLVKKVADIVSGVIKVGKATQADQDGDGNNIPTTYYKKAGDVMTGTLRQKKGECTILNDVASMRIPYEHKGWIALDFGLESISLMGEICLYKYGWGGIVIDFSGYTYVGTGGANNWYVPRYGVHGSISPMPQIAFAKDNATGHRYLLIGGDNFTWGQYDYIALTRIVLGSIGNDTRDRTWAFTALTGTLAELGITTIWAAEPSVNIEVDKARKAVADGDGKNIPDTYLPKELTNTNGLYKAVRGADHLGSWLNLVRLSDTATVGQLRVNIDGTLSFYSAINGAKTYKIFHEGNLKPDDYLKKDFSYGVADPDTIRTNGGFYANTHLPSGWPWAHVYAMKCFGTGVMQIAIRINDSRDIAFRSTVTEQSEAWTDWMIIAKRADLPTVTYSTAEPANPKNGDIWIIPTD